MKSFPTVATWAVLALPIATAFTSIPLAKTITFRTSPLFGKFVDNDPLKLGNLGKVDAILTYPIEESFQNITRAGTNLGDSAFFFSGETYCRLDISAREIKKGRDGNSRNITDRNGFKYYPNNRIDACLLFPPGHEKRNFAYIFFKGEYFEYDLTKGRNTRGTMEPDKSLSDKETDGKVGGPFQLSDLIGQLSDLIGQNSLDAVCVFPPGEGPDGDKNEYSAYFFFGDKYVVWNLKFEMSEKVVSEPKNIKEGFSDYPFDTVDAVLEVPSGAYFFNKDGKYSKYEFYKPLLSTVRFNKYPPILDENKAAKNLYATGAHKKVFPASPASYPLTNENAAILKTETEADSVVIANDDDQLSDNDSKKDYWETDNITGAKVKPIFPGDDGFWDQMKDVITAQTNRTNGISPTSLYHWPELWDEKPALSPWPRNEADTNKLTLEDIAHSVNGDFSNYHQLILLRTFSSVALSTDIGLPKDSKTFIRSKRDFIGTQLRMAAINAWSLEMVGPVNFMLKWRYGMPRPEEVAWLIEKGKIEAPENIVKEMALLKKAMKKKGIAYDKATDFTAYRTTGSPTHPSFPAMHSAGSTCSLWIPVLYDISAEQYLQALLTDYGVAFARTVAGVHYPQDNIAGLNIGQRIIREKLPKFLSENYNYDAGKVEAKVKALSFDWSKVKFTANGCIIGNMSHEEFLENAKDQSR